MADIAAQLGKMYGPLPLGAWLAIVGGGLGLAAYNRNRSSTETEWTSDGGNDGASGTGGSGLFIPLDPQDSGNQTEAPADTRPTTNEEWASLAITYLISKGYSGAESSQAIGKYITGMTPSSQEKAMQDVAMRGVGAPPIPVTIIGGIPTTPKPSTGAVYKPVATRTPTGYYHPKTSAGARAYDKYGKASSTVRKQNYNIRITQWGQIGSTWYGLATTAFYRQSDLVQGTYKKPSPTKGTISAKPVGGFKPVTPAKKPTVKAPVKAPPKKSTVTYHTVRKGENLSSIASKYKTTWQKIFSLNKGIIKSPNVIYPGQKIRVK